MNETMPQDTGAAVPSIPGMSVKVYPVKEPDKLLAFANVNLGGVFAINNIRIYNSEKGPFVAMPSTKGKDGVSESGGATFCAWRAPGRRQGSGGAPHPGPHTDSGQRGALICSPWSLFP